MTLDNIQEGVLDRTGGDSLQWLQEARKESLVPDLHLPLSPSKRPWWRITAKVRKEERGHGEVHDRKEKRYCELPLGFLLCGPTELRQPGRTPNNVMCFPRSLQILCSKTIKNNKKNLLFHEVVPVKQKNAVECIENSLLAYPKETTFK